MEITLYLEVNLVCIAILFTVYVRDAQQRNNDTYHILFTRVLFSNILFFVSDILWGLMSLTTHPHIWQNWVVNIFYFSMSGMAAYFWLVFVEKMLEPKFTGRRKFAALRMLPAALLIVLSIASVKTHWLFYIDDFGRYQRGSLYLLQPVLAYLLPVYATWRAVRAMRQSRNHERKKLCRSLALFYVLPAVGGICQVVLMGTPMLNIGIALSGLWVYFTFQDNVIMLDSLTGMNNRRCFDRTLEAQVHGFTAEGSGHLWLILMDVDYFKKINDGFGHAEGDHALMTIATVLMDVAGTHNCMAARIGGDEFAICAQAEDDTLPEKICCDVREQLAKKSSAYPFRITLSMGVADYEAGMSPQQLYVTADKRLYEAKKAR